jgi:hypothetical protein
LNCEVQGNLEKIGGGNCLFEIVLIMQIVHRREIHMLYSWRIRHLTGSDCLIEMATKGTVR